MKRSPRQADYTAYKKRIKDGRAGLYEWHAYCLDDYGDKKAIRKYPPKELHALREFYRTLSDRKRNEFRRCCLTNSVADFVQREKKEKVREEKKEGEKMTLRHALVLLNACFSVNKNVKKWAYKREYEDDRDFEGWVHVDYTLRDKMYNQKTALIIAIIRGIRENRLPIKYGKNKGIIYFEYLGRQVSFHDPQNIIHCKPYAGVWCGRRNKKIPFGFIN